MYYQTPAPYPQNASQGRPGRKRATRATFSFNDPVQFAANEQGFVTFEQRAMLRKIPSTTMLTLWGLLAATTAIPSLAFFIYVLVTPPVFDPLNQPFIFGLKAWVAFIPCLFGLVMTILSLLGHSARVARLLQMAEMGRFERAQGEVAWSKQRYIARLSGRVLKVRTEENAPALPPPGPYHFYYLTDTGVLLSARPITTYTDVLPYPGLLASTGLPGNEQARLALQLALSQTLNFTNADLEANRRGELGAEQRTGLSRDLHVTTFIASVLLSVGIVVTVGSFVAPHLGTFPDFTWADWFAIPAALWAFVYLAFFRKRFVATLRQMPRPVQQFEGYIQTRIEEIAGDADSNTTYKYYYEFGKESFKVSEQAYNAFVPGVRYRAYYLPSVNRLLSLEPLEAPQR